MNEAVAELLNSYLETLDHEIVWHRKKVAELAVETDRVGEILYQLTAERQAILDHLEVHGGEPAPARMWKSLTEVPKGLPVNGAKDGPGEAPWEGEGPDGTTEFDRWGPFTEVLEEK